MAQVSLIASRVGICGWLRIRCKATRFRLASAGEMGLCPQRPALSHAPTWAGRRGRPYGNPYMVDTRILLWRSLSSLILWTLVLTMVILDWRTGCWLVIASFGLLAQREFYRAEQTKGHIVYSKFGLFCGFLLFLNSWYFLVWKGLGEGDPHSLRVVETVWWVEGVIVVFCIIGSLIRLVVSGEPKPQPIVSLALTIFGFLYVPYLFNFVAKIAFWPDPVNETRIVLVYLLAVTKFSDLGAYVTGILLGRHKMIPRVSPGKTWEGFAGGIAISLGVSLALVWYFPVQLQGIGMWGALLLGIVLPLISVVGDLAESVIKRDAAIKDSGRSIPGIGGALDLVDSILFTAPVLFFYLYSKAHL